MDKYVYIMMLLLYVTSTCLNLQGIVEDDESMEVSSSDLESLLLLVKVLAASSSVISSSPTH